MLTARIVAATRTSHSECLTLSSIRFSIPEDPRLLAAIAELAIRHGRLDYMLKMTVRTLDGLTIEEALKSTRRKGSWRLRELIRQKARKKIAHPEVLSLLEGLLSRAESLTERRNELLHGLWAVGDEERQIIGDRLEGWQAQPTVDELSALSSQMKALTEELTEARQCGFLRQALDGAAVAAE